MKNRRNYYRLLHVQPDAPAEIIRSSYRTIMHRMRMHPDLGGDSERAAMLNEAYEILSDPDKRAQYDEMYPALEPNRARADHTQLQSPVAGTLPGPARETCIFCKYTQACPESTQVQAVCTRCRSPLVLNQPALIEDSDRRAIMRMAKQLPLSIYTGWPQLPGHGLSCDLSLNGMKIHSDLRLFQNQLIKLDSPILSAVGRVIRCRPEGAIFVAGVEFVRLNFVESRGTFVAVRA